MMFVDMLQYLQLESFGNENVSLCVVGSCDDPQYKKCFTDKLEKYCKQCNVSYVTRDFLGKDEFGVVLQSSIVNVHTSLKEPYGMTIMECAAFQTPSILHFENIGADEILGKNKTVSPCAFYSDMSNPKQLALDVFKVLDLFFKKDDTYHNVAVNAQNISLGYGVDTFQKYLTDFIAKKEE